MIKTISRKLTFWYRSRDERGRPVVEMDAARIQGTQLLPSREALLERLPQNAVVSEIGVDMGDFSQQILNISQPAHLHLIDLWPPSTIKKDRYQQVADRFQPLVQDGQVTLHRGDSEATLETFPDHTFDWVYLDTTHMYEKTVRELEILARKVKPGGYICGHDYTLGAWKYGVRFGVIPAVNDFCNRHEWDLAFLTNESHRYISYALRHRNA